MRIHLENLTKHQDSQKKVEMTIKVKQRPLITKVRIKETKVRHQQTTTKVRQMKTGKAVGGRKELTIWEDWRLLGGTTCIISI